jgi:hypothetical protein
MPFLESSISDQLAYRNHKLATTMAEASAEEVMARFEELTVLESEFDDVELELSATCPYLVPFLTQTNSRSPQIERFECAAVEEAG